MQSKGKSEKTKKSGAQGVKNVRSGAAGRDGGSAQLRTIAKVMGNEHLRDALQGTAQQRDAMLAHICERLKVLESAQSKEEVALGKEREWFREVALGHEGHSLPDLTRWHESAQLYKRAGEALARGHLGRGAQLLQQAAEAEQRVFDTTPAYVKAEFEEHEVSVSAPEAAEGINDEANCSTCETPKDLKIADQILSRKDRMAKAPPLPRRRPAWFEEHEQEEEKKDDED